MLFYKHILLILLLLLLQPLMLIAQEVPQQKKIIKLGWDYFDVNQLITQGDSIQKNLPFDGIVFSINRKKMQAFDTGKLPVTYFKFNDLKKIKWTKFTDNFISVWGFGDDGAHWFDDRIWQNIDSNLYNLSMAINESKAEGIFFDAEYYLNDKSDLSPWIYNSNIYPHKSFLQVSQQVKKRGGEVMNDLQSSKSDIKVFAVWMLGLVIEQLRYTSLENAGQALLPSFFEGMLQAKNAGAAIIDGNETAYWYDKASDFILAKKNLKTKGLPLLDSMLYMAYEEVSIAQPVFIDGLLGVTKEFNKRGYDTVQKQNWLANNLLYAIATSDKYMWLYSERINWFTNKDIINKLETAKKRIYTKAKDSSCKGFFENNDLVNTKLKKSKNRYTYYNSTKTLTLKFKKTPVCVSVYENATLIDNYDSIKLEKLNIDLSKKYSGKGSLNILISYKMNALTTITEAAIVK